MKKIVKLEMDAQDQQQLRDIFPVTALTKKVFSMMINFINARVDEAYKMGLDQATPGQEWSSTPPTAPGYYWLRAMRRGRPLSASIVEVVPGVTPEEEPLMVMVMGGDPYPTTCAQYAKNQWAGPIHE